MDIALEHLQKANLHLSKVIETVNNAVIIESIAAIKNDLRAIMVHLETSKDETINIHS